MIMHILFILLLICLLLGLDYIRMIIIRLGHIVTTETNEYNIKIVINTQQNQVESTSQVFQYKHVYETHASSIQNKANEIVKKSKDF